MIHNNSTFNSADHVDIARQLRRQKTGTVANPKVQSVGSFLGSPLPTFTSPAAFNPGHLLPSQDITGNPPPMTAHARSAIWSTFAANTSRWFKGFLPTTTDAAGVQQQQNVAARGALPHPTYLNY
jgi:hypothetical protein